MSAPAGNGSSSGQAVERSLLIATLEATADGILVVDHAGKIVRFNERFVKLWRIPTSILDSGDDDRAIAYVLSQLSDPDAFVSKVRELYAHPEQDSFDVLEFHDGRVFERYSIPQRADGRPVGRVWSFRDVTERVREERERAAAEARARHRLDRLESLWRLLTSGDVTSDGLTETILDEGRRALQLDYATLSRVDGDNIVNHVASAKSRRRLRQPVMPLNETVASLVIEAGETLASIDLKHDSTFKDDPRVRKTSLRAAIATPLRIGDRVFVLGFAARLPRAERFSHEDREYVELLAAYLGRLLRMTEQESQITYLAYHDSLTGLENRRRFLERVEEAIARAKRSRRKLALMYIDLDRFKDVNDSLGHVAGDVILGEAGTRLRAIVRSEDAAARFGGDEFAILLTEMASPGEAEALAARTCAALAQPVALEGRRDIQISASIGIAIFPDDGASAGDLLRCADAALYRAKEQGRSRFSFYSQELASALAHRRQLHEGLHAAIEGRQLVLLYQPVMRLDGGIDAAEALLRWNHPERGVVFPGEFIRVAEETGLMVQIGRWVVHEAAAQLGRWSREGRKWRMAVNVSAVQLQDPTFMSHLKASLAEFDVAPEFFEIEITESAALRDPDAAQAIVSDCRRLGMRVALDDFGTHYASLSQLKKLPVDIIKVDKSFVRGLPKDLNDAAIVRSVIALGANFNCAVVAEGVENPEQLAWLRDNGCLLAQGFLLGKPMTVAQFERWAAQREATA